MGQTYRLELKKDQETGYYSTVCGEIGVRKLSEQTFDSQAEEPQEKFSLWQRLVAFVKELFSQVIQKEHSSRIL